MSSGRWCYSMTGSHASVHTREFTNLLTVSTCRAVQHQSKLLYRNLSNVSHQYSWHHKRFLFTQITAVNNRIPESLMHCSWNALKAKEFRRDAMNSRMQILLEMIDHSKTKNCKTLGLAEPLEYGPAQYSIFFFWQTPVFWELVSSSFWLL